MMRSPFSNFVALRDTLDQLADQALSGESSQARWPRAGSGVRAQPMPLDVYATEAQAVITAAVPGMRPEDLEVTVHEQTISLSGTIGTVSETEEAKGATWYVHELGGGTYRRSVTVPFPIDAERVEASFEHGIVRIVAPKAAHAKPRKIAIRDRRTRPAGSTANDSPPDETREAIAAGKPAKQPAKESR